VFALTPDGKPKSDNTRDWRLLGILVPQVPPPRPASLYLEPSLPISPFRRRPSASRLTLRCGEVQRRPQPPPGQQPPQGGQADARASPELDPSLYCPTVVTGAITESVETRVGTGVDKVDESKASEAGEGRGGIEGGGDRSGLAEEIIPEDNANAELKKGDKVLYRQSGGKLVEVEISSRI